MRRGRGNRSLPDIRTRLQCFLASLLEGALFALLVGVAPNQMACASREPLPVETPVETQQKERTAEELMSLLEARWSARDTLGIIALFAPSRRDLASDHANIIQAKLATFAPIAGDGVTSWRLDHRCHGRGEQMLIARIDLSPREAILTRPQPTDHAQARAAMTETLWLVFEQGSWWIYSL